MRSCADINPVIGEQQAGGERESIRKHLHRICTSIAVGILKNFNSISPFLARLCPKWIFVEFDYPETTAIIPSHSDGINHFGFRRKKACLEALDQSKLCLSLSGREGWRCCRCMLTAELASGGRICINRKAEFRMPRKVSTTDDRSQCEQANGTNDQAIHWMQAVDERLRATGQLDRWEVPKIT